MITSTLPRLRLSLTSLTRRFAVSATAVLLIAGCGADDEALTAADEPTSSVDVTTETDTTDSQATLAPAVDGQATSTAEAAEAAMWGDNVEISIEDGSFTFRSDGIPNHELPEVYLVPADGNEPPFGGDDPDEFDIIAPADLLIERQLTATITTNPVYSETVTENTLGQIGVMISGAQMFNDYEDFEGTIALEDNLTIDGASFIDGCNGHPLASGLDYHYHGIPYCITDSVDVAGEHSTLIGFLLDGFPVYGNQDQGGTIVTSADLDECSGHVGPTPEFPDGIYHYHLTDDAAPYSINCFHGEIDYSNSGPGGGGPEGGAAEGGPEGGGPEEGGPDFAGAAAALGITEDELREALGGPPPDFEAASEILGVSAEDIRQAIGGTPPGDG